jgi:hypothetical protein
LESGQATKVRFLPGEPRGERVSRAQRFQTLAARWPLLSPTVLAVGLEIFGVDAR